MLAEPASGSMVFVLCPSFHMLVSFPVDESEKEEGRQEVGRSLQMGAPVWREPTICCVENKTLA